MTTREEVVWASLAPVTDPELDESVTELGFVSSVEVTDADVHVRFRLPTYWCAANFAYMMASDMHHAVKQLPWVQSVVVELDEHMYSDTINRGISASLSFQDTFGDEANGELNVVRETFRRKAFQQRQELLLRYFMEQDRSANELVSMTMADLRAYRFNEPDGQRLHRRYLEIRQEFGGDATPDKLAFVTVEGAPVKVSQFSEYMLELRRVRINTQFNGEMCRGLLQARYGDSQGQGNNTEVRMDFHQLDSLRSSNVQAG